MMLNPLVVCDNKSLNWMKNAKKVEPLPVFHAVKQQNQATNDKKNRIAHSKRFIYCSQLKHFVKV